MHTCIHSIYIYIYIYTLSTYVYPYTDAHIHIRIHVSHSDEYYVSLRMGMLMNRVLHTSPGFAIFDAELFVCIFARRCGPWTGERGLLHQHRSWGLFKSSWGKGFLLRNDLKLRVCRLLFFGV